MNAYLEKWKRELHTALEKNKKALVAEIYETRELVQLLTKGTHTKLSAEEKKKIHDQLIDILRTIPAFAIFALPGGGILLPIVLKVLPFPLLPDNFIKLKEEYETKPKEDSSQAGSTSELTAEDLIIPPLMTQPISEDEMKAEAEIKSKPKREDSQN